MPNRSLLPEEQRLAIKAALEELKMTLARASGKRPSDAAVGKKLGVSQAAINKAIKYAEVGPTIRDSLLEHLGTDMRTLIQRHLPQSLQQPTSFPLSVPKNLVPPNARAVMASYPPHLHPMLELVVAREGGERTKDFWRNIFDGFSYWHKQVEREREVEKLRAASKKK